MITHHAVLLLLCGITHVIYNKFPIKRSFSGKIIPVKKGGTEYEAKVYYDVW